MSPSTVKLYGASESHKKAIELYLRNWGIPPMVKGYSYILTVLLIMTNYDYTLDDAYAEAALQYWSTSRRIEQAIRHAIEISWSWESEKSLRNIYPSAQMPTNEEFLLFVQTNILTT